MPILGVTRNRHLEIIGQEIRVNHDFFSTFLFAAFLYIWFTFPGHKSVYMYRNKK